MRRALLVSSVTLLLGVGSAQAADMPPPIAAKDPPVVVAAPSWTGCYVDAGGGYGLANTDISNEVLPPGTPTSITTTGGERGWLGRFGGGCDYQLGPITSGFLNGNWVIGAFGDFDAANIQGTLNSVGVGALSASQNETSAWAVGVRLGYAVTPSTLWYVDGGYTQGRFGQGNALINALPGGPFPFAIGPTTFNGWFIGSGTDIALARLLPFLPPGLFLRTEFRFASYAGQNEALVSTATGAPSGFGVHATPYVETVTTSLVYKFNWLDPHGMTTAELPRPTLPVYKAPPLPAPSWSGCYVDGGGGYGLSNTDHFVEILPAGTPAEITTTDGGRGWLGRFGGGCDYQVGSLFNGALNGEWVIGAFGDFDLANIRGTLTDSAVGFSVPQNENTAWAAGLRLGYAVTPSMLWYVDGGYTQARFGQGTLTGFALPGAPLAFTLGPTTYNGWFVGSGTDIALGSVLPILPSGLFLRSEFRFAGYGSNNSVITSTTGVPTAFAERATPFVETVTTALVYKFNWSGR